MLDLSTKRILITGGHGFLGKHIVDLFKEKGINDLLIPTSKECDLRDAYAVKEYFQKYSPEIVVHAAAKMGGIGSNRKYPGEFFYDNASININIVHQSYVSQIEKFVGIGTVCSYPKFTSIPFKEESLWDGYPEETNAPYGLAKKMMLVHTKAYSQQYDFRGTHLLLVNLYGPGDNFDIHSSHVIPALIRKCMIAKKLDKEYIPVWGTGSAYREFIYVRDAADGILKATQQLEDPDPINIGSGIQIKIQDLVEKIMRLTEYKGEIKWDRTKPDGQPRRMLDTSKAKEKFGFEAMTNFEDGLKVTLNYYKEIYYEKDLTNENIENLLL